MGAQPSKLHKGVTKMEKGVKTCLRSGSMDDEDCYEPSPAYQYQAEPVRRRPVTVRQHPHHQQTQQQPQSATRHHAPSQMMYTRPTAADNGTGHKYMGSSPPPPAADSPLSRHSISTTTTTSSRSSSGSNGLEPMRFSSSVREDSPIVSWLSDVNESLHAGHRGQGSPSAAYHPSSSAPTVREALHQHGGEATSHLRHLHHHQGRLAATPRSASINSVGSAGVQRPLQASWNRLETDLEYYGMLLLDKILEQEPQACYLLTFVRHTNINQLLSDLSQQRILAVRIMETVGLMVECADDWKTAEPVLSSLARRHSVPAQDLRYHIQVINSSLFSMLHSAMGADWTAEMATAWKQLLAQVCNTLFHPNAGSQISCNSARSSSNSIAWTSVKWKSSDGKDAAGRKQSNSPLPFKSLDDLSRARQSPPRHSPLNRLPSLRLTRTTSSSPTKEHASRKSSSSSANTSSYNAPPKSPLQRSWSSR